MSRVGFWLIVFGVLNFALPRFGYDLRWFAYLGEARTPLAAGLIVGGVALVLLGRKKKALR